MTLAMYLAFSLMYVALVYAAEDVTTEAPNQCPQPTESNPNPPGYLYGHPNDCRYFFTCAFGTPYLKKCLTGTVWSNAFKTCAGFNGEYDTCTRETAQRECARLPGGPLLIPHPTKCQRYYNCSNTPPPPGGQLNFFGQYEDECPYPELFDVTEKRCRSFREGYCGPGRSPDLDPCDYFRNRCRTSHCQPCNSRLPSCVGLTDGEHEHPLRLWTPWFITCDTQRLASVQTCGEVYPSRRLEIFSPVKNKCVTRWEVPRQFGPGLAPSCDGQAPGQYRTPESAAVYYSCPSEQVFYCETSFQFNETSQICEKV